MCGRPTAYNRRAEAGSFLVWVKNGYRGRSTGTSAVPQLAGDFDAPRKSAEVGQELS